jgi:hypothetical protein
VTGEKTGKSVDADRSIQGLEHVLLSEGINVGISVFFPVDGTITIS